MDTLTDPHMLATRDTLDEAGLRELFSMEPDDELSDVVPVCVGEWRREEAESDRWRAFAPVEMHDEFVPFLETLSQEDADAVEQLPSRMLELLLKAIRFDPATLPYGERQPRIYVASKIAHAPQWIARRAAGAPIVSSWIDDDCPVAEIDFAEMWPRMLSEVSGCSALVGLRLPGEKLEGGFMEIGAALAAGRKAFLVGFENTTIAGHPRVITCASLDEAFERASAEVGF